MNKTKIEWCDSTWNPVTGCYNGCNHCYAKGIARRFGLHGTEADIEKRALDIPATKAGKRAPYPFDFEPTLHRYRLNEPQQLRRPRTIFVCSMADLFGDWVPDKWIEEVFAACEKAPQHRYLFLTKNPIRYKQLHQRGILRKADNIWYGYSAAKNGYALRFEGQYNCFVSVEPIFRNVGIGDTDWVIIGSETGNRKNKVTPQREWITDFVKNCDSNGILVFMKESLLPIVGEENMRRDFPWETGQQAERK